MTNRIQIDTSRPAWFDESYWQQLVFDSLECPNWRSQQTQRPTCGQVASMNFHIQAGGGAIPRDWADRYSELLPSLIRRFTGVSWRRRVTTGPDPIERVGWVSIEAEANGGASGGFWSSGTEWKRGRIRLNPAGEAGMVDWYLKTVTFAHELGHVLGFHHVDDVDDIMRTDTTAVCGICNGWIWKRMSHDGDPVFTARLLRHARLAFSLGDRYAYPGVSWLDSVPRR